MELKKRILACMVVMILLAAICTIGYINQNGIPAMGDSVEQKINSNGTKKIALTFDDGPDGKYTALLLDGLKEREVKVTFFVMGKKAEEYPELVQRMHEDGHLIGNHTYSHMQLSKGKEEQFRKELQKTSDIIKALTGENTEFVRPPYGTWEKRFEDELNMFPVFWTVDPLDWCSSDAACVTRKVVCEIKENGIILMHDQYKSSVTAALSIVDILQEEGYEFVTVEELMFE